MTGILTFDAVALIPLLRSSLDATERRPCYGQKLPVPAGLHFVGDDGVYLMSNAANLPKGPDGKLPVVYARECDPTKMSAGAVWDAKNAIFGGDDGAEFLPADDNVFKACLTALPGDKLRIRLKGNSMVIDFVPTRRPVRA